ncbi:MAG TPA: VCBS repeat-containing protein [Phycisphaerales bacterium]|nr:VCBS repeat-containing protein [Phycisphaerales bacterium]
MQMDRTAARGQQRGVWMVCSLGVTALAGGAVSARGERVPRFEHPIVIASHSGSTWAGRPYGLAAADFLDAAGAAGQDGFPEVVVVNSGGDLLACEPAAWGLVSVFWNTGAWSSGEPGLVLVQEVSVAPGLGTEVVITDIDGRDGPDLVVAATQWVQRGPDAGVYIALNDGVGAFNPAAKHPMPLSLMGLGVTDIDADGRADDVVGATADCPPPDGVPLDFVWVKLGDGAGGFVNQWPIRLGSPSEAAPVDLALADFVERPGPVLPDLVTANPNADAYWVVENLGSGRFRPFTVLKPDACLGDWGMRTIACADINGDGRADFAGVAGLYAQVFLGDGAGGFTSHCDNPGLRSRLRDEDEAPPTFAHGLCIGDLNGGAGLDVAVAMRNLAVGRSEVALLLGRGDGTFHTPTPDRAYVYSVDGDSGDPDDVAAPVCVEITDLNADGFGDIVTTNHYSDTISVLINGGVKSGGRTP